MREEEIPSSFAPKAITEQHRNSGVRKGSQTEGRDASLPTCVHEVLHKSLRRRAGRYHCSLEEKRALYELKKDGVRVLTRR